MASFEEPTLLHNPKCSKSRAAKELLDSKRIVYRVRRYLEEPLSSAELRELARRLDRSPREWVRSGEPAYREAALTSDATDEELFAAMARYPILIERPILIMAERAIVGRPPERVLELLK
jgi:arsenate reductase